LALQGGRDAVESDASGLLLPPNKEAVAWLREFWATGSPRRALPLPPAGDDGERAPRAGPPCGAAGAPRAVRNNVIIVPAGDAWTADK
jgi:hypothetical protein